MSGASTVAFEKARKEIKVFLVIAISNYCASLAPCAFLSPEHHYVAFGHSLKPAFTRTSVVESLNQIYYSRKAPRIHIIPRVDNLFS